MNPRDLAAYILIMMPSRPLMAAAPISFLKGRTFSNSLCFGRVANKSCLTRNFLHLQQGVSAVIIKVIVKSFYRA